MFRLKIELLCHGCALSSSARAALPSFRSGATTVRDYPTTSGLIIRLPGDLYVNARIQVGGTALYLLDHDGDRFVLIAGAQVLPVEVFPPAAYARENRRLPNGKSIRLVANTHADRVRLTPIHGCGLACQFCNYPGMAYRKNTVDEIQAALEIALGDSIIHPPHVLVSGGSPRRDEQDYKYMNAMYDELPSRFAGLRFDAMFTPRTLHVGPATARRYASFARFLKDAGYHALSVNLEFYSDEVLQRYAHDKAEIGRDQYLLFLERAVDVFGVGEVRSVLIVGLEDDVDTLRGVDALAARGVLVELSPFNAFSGTVLGSHPEPTPDRLIGLYERASGIAERHGVPLSYFCVPCSHNIL